MSPVNTSGWQYADFDSEPTAELQYAKLLLHLAEVRQTVVEQGTGRGRTQKIDPDYLPTLEKRAGEYRLASAFNQMQDCPPTNIIPMF